MTESYDIICIGAGPTGLATAIEARIEGLSALVIDKGCLCNSLLHYPANMVFFTTPERMEIGQLPMTVASGKPTRAEALKYYRRAVEHYGLEVHQYERVGGVTGHDGAFIVHTVDSQGQAQKYHAKKIVVATGFYDHPNYLNVRGENLPHVSHYFTEPFPYWNQNVAVIGGGNSAAEAALDLFRAGARVTIIHRGAEMGRTLKYWVKPDIENRIRAGEICAKFHAHVVAFEPQHVLIKDGKGEGTIPASQVFALTGYHPDFEFLEKLGIRLATTNRKPAIDPETLESNIPGIYLAGVVIGGDDTSHIFIENGRFHGRQIIAAITGKGKLPDQEPVAAPGE
ncbi:MAG: YpdA family putative bacillithiol disulfide reductase [Candidatus Acidiferrales bacterium]|jgi:thioredoxin reductase (NADPH)